MIEGIPIAELSARALLGIVVLLIFLGKLIPRSFFDVKAKEADQWREAYERERDARALGDAQISQLMEQGKTTHEIVTKLLPLATKTGASDETSQNVS